MCTDVERRPGSTRPRRLRPGRPSRAPRIRGHPACAPCTRRAPGRAARRREQRRRRRPEEGRARHRPRLAVSEEPASSTPACARSRNRRLIAPPRPHTSRRTHDRVAPSPIAWHVARWADDPWSRGSWSFIRPGGSPRDRATLGEPVHGRVVLAGEATHPEQPGMVHGAWLTGVRAAESVRAGRPAGRARRRHRRGDGRPRQRRALVERDRQVDRARGPRPDRRPRAHRRSRRCPRRCRRRVAAAALA